MTRDKRSELRSAREYHEHAERQAVEAFALLKQHPTSFPHLAEAEGAMKRLDYFTTVLIEAAQARSNVFRGQLRRAKAEARKAATARS